MFFITCHSLDDIYSHPPLLGPFIPSRESTSSSRVLKQFGRNRWRSAAFHVTLLLSTIIYTTSMPCRRKSVKEKKKERKGKKMRAKHQKHGHPRLMTAMQRCLHNRFNAECISLRVSPSCLGIYKVAAVSVIRDEGSPRILSATFSVAKQR